MSRCPRLLVSSAIATLLAAGPAFGGAPDPGNRNNGLAHICQGGDNKNNTCDANNGDGDCPGGKCVFKFNEKTYAAKMTAVFDDFVTPPGSESTANGHALTVLLEMKVNGQKQVFAETYSDGFNDMFFGVWNNPVTESDLVLEPPGDFVSQNPPGGLADALRAALNETGTPVIVKTGKSVQATDASGTNLGSVIKLKVKLRFVAP